MKPNLWDAVENNEQIELLLTILEDAFKQLKQKGYKMNFNVQEKLKEIDKQINKLLENQTKEKDQDLAIVEQFFSELQRVRQEMIALGQVDDLVLAVKLNKVYEFYKGYIPLTDEVMGYYYQKLSS
jgi:hypothetical protein